MGQVQQVDYDDFRKLGKLLLTGNPFYLISAALALYASTVIFDTSNIWMESGVPIGILAGYTALCAATAIFIVRKGKVWDDACTLLFIILTLPLALSVSLDDKLIDRPEVGAVWLIASLCFTGGVTLWIRNGLKLDLGRFHWCVYAGLLGIFFLYPYVLSRLVVEFADNRDPATWGIILFPAVFAAGMLPLLYAVNRKRFTPENGTPYRKLPVALYGILWIAAFVRGYLLNISFYAGKGMGGYGELESGFAGWMTLPLLLAGAVLLAEYFIVRDDRWKRLIPISVGVLVIFLIFGSFGAPEEQGRLQRLFFYLAWGRAASGMAPPFLAAALFFFYLSVRRIWWAIPVLLLAAAAFAYAQFRFPMPEISAKTLLLSGAALVGIVLFVLALVKRGWLTLYLLLLYGTAGIGFWLYRSGHLHAVYPVLAAEVAVTLCVGWFAKQRGLQAMGLTAAVIFFIAMVFWMIKEPNWENAIYLAVIFAVSLLHLKRFWLPAVLETGWLLILGGVYGYRMFAAFAWKGGGIVFASLLIFGAAFAISLFKAGLLQRYWKQLEAKVRRKS